MKSKTRLPRRTISRVCKREAQKMRVLANLSRFFSSFRPRFFGEATPAKNLSFSVLSSFLSLFTDNFFLSVWAALFVISYEEALLIFLIISACLSKLADIATAGLKLSDQSSVLNPRMVFKFCRKAKDLRLLFILYRIFCNFGIWPARPYYARNVYFILRQFAQVFELSADT